METQRYRLHVATTQSFCKPSSAVSGADSPGTLKSIKINEELEMPSRLWGSEAFLILFIRDELGYLKWG